MKQREVDNWAKVQTNNNSHYVKTINTSDTEAHTVPVFPDHFVIFLSCLENNNSPLIIGLVDMDGDKHGYSSVQHLFSLATAQLDEGYILQSFKPRITARLGSCFEKV